MKSFKNSLMSLEQVRNVEMFHQIVWIKLVACWFKHFLPNQKEIQVAGAVTSVEALCFKTLTDILLKSFQVMVHLHIFDILISGKNIVISAERWQHFCQKWKYRKNMLADHNLNGLYEVLLKLLPNHMELAATHISL